MPSEPFHYSIRRIREAVPSPGFRRTPVARGSFLRFFKEHPYEAYGLLLAALMSFFLFQLLDRGMLNYYLRTSLIDVHRTYIPFTGTVYPVQYVPKWSELTETERFMRYEEIPQHKLQPLPAYDLAAFARGQYYDTAAAGDVDSYVTWSVPYAGNYALDGTEWSGSHPGVDIKMPVGTPVQSIAAGLVVKRDSAPDGFGQHIVIAHPNVPDPQNPGQTTTLYSGYAHLSEQLVAEGDRVEKGQLIGKSGQTGMATAPHLHFQLDTDSAPFYPYWPFTWADMQEGGISSTFEAVREGLNQDNIRRYSVHPVAFVTAHLHDAPLVEVASVGVLDSALVSVERFPAEKPPLPEPLLPSASTVPEENTSTPRPLRLTPPPSQQSSTPRPRGIPAPVTPVVETANSSVLSGPSSDDNSNAVPIVAPRFTDVAPGTTLRSVLGRLSAAGIFSGYSDGSFRPESTLNRAEATKVVLSASETSLEPSTIPFFRDLERGAWYIPWVATASKKGIVTGYSHDTFRPEKSVTLAEFLKLSITSLSREEELEHQPGDIWQAPYERYARTHRLLPEERLVRPDDPITRAEAALVIDGLL
ncbi:peptidoglycan DD-metalloendopeptidase family protein [Candidatus Peribacteria bacterium]|nr:peptidoglycan DD-metalloendopeptidase family protein [Candidatus Peribacteria bacterium]